MLSSYILSTNKASLNHISETCKSVGTIDVVGAGNKVTDVFSDYRNLGFNLLILDVDGLSFNGFDVIKTLPEKILTLVTSIHAKNAVAAFDSDVVDFVKKPFTKKRMAQGIAKLYRRYNEINAIERDFVFVKHNDHYIKVACKDIVYAMADNDNTKLYTRRQSYLVSSNLSAIQKMLPNKMFCRVHRSYLVNITHIDSFSTNKIHLLNNLLPVSRAGKKELEGFLPLL